MLARAQFMLCGMEFLSNSFRIAAVFTNEISSTSILSNSSINIMSH